MEHSGIFEQCNVCIATRTSCMNYLFTFHFISKVRPCGYNSLCSLISQYYAAPKWLCGPNALFSHCRFVCTDTQKLINLCQVNNIEWYMCVNPSLYCILHVLQFTSSSFIGYINIYAVDAVLMVCKQQETKPNTLSQ